MISLTKIDPETLIEVVRELLNKDKGFNLIPFEEKESVYKPDLWQGEVNSTYPRAICEIKSANISDFDLFNSILQHCGALIKEYSSEVFILVVLRNLSIQQRTRLEQDFQPFRIKELQVYDIADIEKLLTTYPEIEKKYRTVISTWYEAYSHIAEILNEFLKSHQESPASAIFTKLENTAYYEYNSNRIFQYDEETNIKGLDPIQIFASFNYTKIKIDSRVENINLLLAALDSNNKVDEKTDFSGCPSPIITQIIYNRKIEIQNQIWDTFNSVMEGEPNGLTQAHYNNIDKWYGIGIPAFTIFLFWIKSDVFIPLDENTSTFIVGLRIVDSKPSNYQEYISLCEKFQFNEIGELANGKDLIRIIVKEAYNFVPKGSSEIPFDSKLSTFIKILKDGSDEGIENLIEFSSQNFKLIALRPKQDVGETEKESTQNRLKNLTGNELYKFHHSYNIHADDSIEFISSTDSLYNNENLRISISAIVGKNGSGKSTLTEFLYLIINKLAFKKGFISDEELIDETISADLYIKTDKLYKISVGAEINIWDYYFDKESGYFKIAEQLVKNDADIAKFNFSKFFYSIVVNYSLYSLNSEIIGDWITPLFLKNDSYQIPIVLNPKREEGTINVLSEEALAKARLLSSILEPKGLNIIDKKVPELISGKIPAKLKLEIDSGKQLRKRNKYFKSKDLSDVQKAEIEDVFSLFLLIDIKAKDCVDDIKEYIYCKLASICSYPQFEKHKNIWNGKNFNKSKLKGLIEDVIGDTSHVTFKLKQAVNYLKFGHFNLGAGNDIYYCAKRIGDIQKDEFEKEEKSVIIKTIELIPPSFFKSNVLFLGDQISEKNSFNELSSGEKQQIFSINTIAYHVYNLDSVVQKQNVLKYSYVNIIFDEVELYFHPDMQRTYIMQLINRLTFLELEYLRNINIIFVTHSPFILSDIPNSNILKLKEGTALPYIESEQTFGANVHDLLANDFFMENGFMGEFSKNKILTLSDHLNDCVENSNNIKDDSKWNKKDAEQFISLIGEPLIQDSLNDLFSYVYNDSL